MLRSHRKTIVEILGRRPIHPFPARMAPGIALEALGETGRSLRVLDPMAGSGTVLAVARSKGHRAIGVDLDPLAVLLSEVWTSTVDADAVRGVADEVLCRSRLTFKSLRASEAYPAHSDDETRKFIRYWFDDYARRQLAALSLSIGRVRDDVTRRVLWCAFSRLIITKTAGASLAMDLAHSRPHRHFTRAPVKPFARFRVAVEAVVSNCPQRGAERVGPPANVSWGDARRLQLPADSIDIVLTSPPYLNGIDYLRCSKFSLVWMGHAVRDLREIRSLSVGTEATRCPAEDSHPTLDVAKRFRRTIDGLSRRDNAILARYAADMSKALSEVKRVLRKGGRAVYVVGDSTTRGVYIRNSAIVIAAAEQQGLVLKSSQTRELPANRRYLPPPVSRGSGNRLDGRLRREVVVELTKP